MPKPLFFSTMSMTLVSTIPMVAALIANSAIKIVTRLASRNLCKKEELSHTLITSVINPIPSEKKVVFTTVVILVALSSH